MTTVPCNCKYCDALVHEGPSCCDDCLPKLRSEKEALDEAYAKGLAEGKTESVTPNYDHGFASTEAFNSGYAEGRDQGWQDAIEAAAKHFEVRGAAFEASEIRTITPTEAVK